MGSITAGAHPQTSDRPPVSSRREKEVKGEASLSEAARVAAERRWHTALHTSFAKSPKTYERIVIQIDAELRTAATEAEINQHGAGLIYILQQLQAPELKPTVLDHGSQKDESL